MRQPVGNQTSKEPQEQGTKKSNTPENHKSKRKGNQVNVDL